MRRCLRDTRFIPQWLSGSVRLREGPGSEIADLANPVYVSVAAAWEMASKGLIGRLEITSNLEQALASGQISVLRIALEDALAVADRAAGAGDPRRLDPPIRP